jgi:hypothetical protein
VVDEGFFGLGSVRDEINFVNDLIKALPELKTAYDEHVATFGEVLPYRFMSDLARLATLQFVSAQDDGREPERVVRVLRVLEDNYQSGNPAVDDLINRAFLYAIPWYEDEMGHEVVEILPPKLAQAQSSVKSQMNELVVRAVKVGERTSSDLGWREPGLEQKAVLRDLLQAVPELEPVFREHLEDHEGEVLTSLLMSEVATWTTERFLAASQRGEDPEEARRVLGFLEDHFFEGDSGVDGMISASFLEMLPWYEDEDGTEIEEILPPKLARSMAKLKTGVHGAE